MGGLLQINVCCLCDLCVFCAWSTTNKGMFSMFCDVTNMYVYVLWVFCYKCIIIINCLGDLEQINVCSRCGLYEINKSCIIYVSGLVWVERS